MKRILGCLSMLLALAAPAHAQKSKSQLTTEVNTNYPDNTTGAITPSLLRTTTLDIMNSSQQYSGVNAQVGTTYAFAASDYGQLVTFNNSAPVAASLSQAVGTFSPWNAYVSNLGLGTVTITPATSTIGGQSTLVLATGQSAQIVSDGFNYQVLSYSAGGSNGGVVIANVVTFGADNTCTNDSTTAFQNAWNAAAAAGGSGVVYVPPVASSGCYLVTKLNGTNANNVRVIGNGDKSLIKINGNDADGNWWDLSGSSNISFQNLKFIDNGSPTRIAFLWACTGTSCGTSGVVAGLNFDHVNVNAKFVLAGLYAYGYGPLTSSFAGGGAL